MKQIEELYDKYCKNVYNYFYYLTYDIEKSNDLTQETFYQVILSIVRFRGDSKISTWIFSIARNTYLKSLRKDNKSNFELDENIPVLDESYMPEESLEKKEKLRKIIGTIKQLPEKYATVLILRDKGGLSYKEISKITGMSDASVKVSLFRARKKFKELYEKEEKRWNF